MMKRPYNVAGLNITVMISMRRYGQKKGKIETLK